MGELMRVLLLPIVLLAAGMASQGNSAGPYRAELVCPQDPAPEVRQICDAVGVALREAGYDLQRNAPLRLILEAGLSVPATLKARMTVERNGQAVTGEELMLSMTDRCSIPVTSIRKFARLLVARMPVATR